MRCADTLQRQRYGISGCSQSQPKFAGPVFSRAVAPPPPMQRSDDATALGIAGLVIPDRRDRSSDKYTSKLIFNS